MVSTVFQPAAPVLASIVHRASQSDLFGTLVITLAVAIPAIAILLGVWGADRFKNRKTKR